MTNESTPRKEVSALKIAVRTMYDMQKLRIQSGNRLAASWRQKMGLDVPGEDEENDKEANDILKNLLSEYKRLTDGVVKYTKATKFDSTILTTKGEMDLISAYVSMLKAEESYAKVIQAELESYPIWTEYLIHIKGCGFTMAAVIISEVDINIPNSIAALHAYAGLDVVKRENDEGGLYGVGRSRKKESLVEKTYRNRDGDEVKTVGISFNPLLKTKLIGVLGTSFIKCNSPYKKVYNDYKFRLENDPRHKEKTKAHRHAMSVRYMVKIFLAELWTEWRTMEGLELKPAYHVAKLGMQDHPSIARSSFKK